MIEFPRTGSYVQSIAWDCSIGPLAYLIDEHDLMDDSRRCTATAKSTGERCKRAAVAGGNVCSMHGGKAPQVQKKAQERLDRMADSTTADLQHDIEDLQDEYEAAGDIETKLNILSEIRKNWKIILDRTGHGPTAKRELEHSGEGGGPLVVIEDSDEGE